MRNILVICLFLASCSSTPEIKKKSIEVSLYKLAKKQKSCNGFQALHSEDEKNFPLKSLISVQILAHCELSEEDFFKITGSSNIHSDNYLMPMYAEHAYNQAKRLTLFKEAIVYGETYIKFLKTKKEKETLAKDLVKLVKLSKIKSLEKAATDILFRYAPRLIPKPETHQLYNVARDFEKIRQFKKARRFYQKIIDDKNIDSNERMHAYFRKAMTYKLARDKQTYARVLMSMMFWIKRENLDEKAEANEEIYENIWKYRLLCIRARWTNGLANKSLEQINYYLETFPKMSSKTKADLLLVRGQIHREKKNYNKANEDFRLVTEQELVSTETLEKASWSLAWNFYLTEQFNEAVEILDKVISQSEDFNEVKKHYYWKAKALSKLKQEKLAARIYEKVSEEDPFGYYGILSTYQLDKTFPPLSFSHYPPQTTKDINLKWLKALGEDELIKEYLKKKDDYSSYTDFHYAGWYDGGLFHFFKLDDEKKADVYKSDLPLAYPTPYKEDFQEASRLTGLPTSFLYSIARQESAFNIYARSWADAFGLLQVTPEKAKVLSRKYKVPYKDINDLYSPQTNLPLGSYLLKELVNKTNGEFITVVASYNAGRNPVKSWYKTRFREDPVEFIERIPYKETRTYVKLIFRNYIIYSRLLGEKRKNGLDLLYSTLL